MNRIILTLVLSITLISCSDFLTESPKDEQVINQYFTDPSHAYNIVNSIYRTGVGDYISGGTYGGNRAMLGNYLSGLYKNEYEGQEIHASYSRSLTLDGNNMGDYLGSYWDDFYEAISYANIAIKHTPDTPDLSDGEKNILLAESKFFRAFSYFILTKTFGQVPLITDPYESQEGMYVKESPIADVYALIIEDLKFATTAGNLPQGSMKDNAFRITKETAEMVLSDVYLTMSGYPLQQDNYANAATAAKAVINNTSFMLYQNDDFEDNSAYNKLRKADFSDETIYALEYETGISTSSYTVWSYPNSVGNKGYFTYAVFANAYEPTNQIVWAYDDVNDLRIKNGQMYHTAKSLEKDGVITDETFTIAPYMWHDDDALFSSGQSGKDATYYRLSEAYLIAAEAIVKSEGAVTQEAIGYLADVKERAFYTMTRAEIEASIPTDIDGFVEEVWSEKLRECSLEFKLWSDIQRTRMYPSTSESNRGTVTWSNVIGHTSAGVDKAFTESHLLFPIPEPERERNPELGQNAGY